MANIATNIVRFHFLNTPTPEYKIAALQSFFEDFDIAFEVYEKEEDLKIYDCVDFEFGSKWSEPTEYLQDLCNKYNIKIIGVCYEWGCDYVSSFELVPKIIEEITESDDNIENEQLNL